MNHKRRRLAIGVVGLVLIATIVAGMTHATRMVSVGVAYKAKMLCSEVFVAGRDPREVLADLEVDDLALLRYVTVSIDPNSKSVTTTALGIIKRQAVYHEDLGCTLLFDGLAPTGLHSGHGDSAARAGTRSQGLDGPLGARATIENGERERLQTILDRAFAEPNPLRKRRTRAVVIVHKGHMVAEQYATGVGPEMPLIGWSMTKSVMNALAGVLVKEGRLSLDGLAPIPEWQTPGDPRGHITLDQLLRMSSGLRFDEDMTYPLADVMRMLLGVADMATYATTKELEATPGTKWQYSSGTSNIIARIMRNVLKDDCEYLTFPRRALFDRIGMTGAVLETDAAGTFVGSSFMYATARDWARFGILYLQDGVWDGQRILPEGWVAYTRLPAPADPRRRYGAHFWLDVPDEYRATDGSLPNDAFHAVGHEGQFVTVVPSCETVIVRLGLTRYADAWDHAAFVREVLAALGCVRE